MGAQRWSAAVADAIPEPLLRKKELFYVPREDQDFDVIYLRTESGEQFAHSFSELAWRSVGDARGPSTVDDLLAATLDRQDRQRELE